MAVHLTQKELAELVGRTDRQIRNINSALPEGQELLVKAAGGKYDAVAFVQRWIEIETEKRTEEKRGHIRRQLEAIIGNL